MTSFLLSWQNKIGPFMALFAMPFCGPICHGLIIPYHVNNALSIFAALLPNCERVQAAAGIQEKIFAQIFPDFIYVF